ncbi:MAG: phosphatase PAP2 family protein, partial [Rhodanobacter sp.]
MQALRLWLLAAISLFPAIACASGGPLGIDHRIHYDNSGIWKRSTQTTLIYGTVVTVVGGALAFGDQDKLGDTFWRSVDALAVTSIGTTGLKYAFQRERPSQTSDPNHFFAGTHAQSFPSGEVAA